MSRAKPEAARLIDISLPLGPETPVYPGDPPFERRVVCAPDPGHPFELSSLRMSAHTGTHLDAPKHFIAGGRALDQATPSAFILPAKVIESDNPAVLEEDLADILPQPGRAILFRTRNSVSGLNKRQAFSPDYVYVSLEAARRCLALGAPLVGLDYLSVDRHGDDNYPVHQMLLGAGCFVLEGLDLEAAQPGEYLLICLPLNIQGGEASPVRAVLASPAEIHRLSLTLGSNIY